jgi:hypothetical protein
MNITQLINDKGNAVKNQFIITSKNEVTFQSYNSKIATYNEDKKILILYGDLWDYSGTTRKHFKTFLNDFTPLKYENKNQFIELKNTSKFVTIK